MIQLECRSPIKNPTHSVLTNPTPPIKPATPQPCSQP